MKKLTTVLTALVLVLGNGANAQLGNVVSHQKISDTQGNFSAGLDDSDMFGQNIANLGDLNGDGKTDIAVAAPSDDDGGTERGAIYILFLNVDGTVSSFQKISDTQGNFTGVLDDGDGFGSDVSNIGDMNNDGVIDLAVCARADDDGGTDRGAVWILFLNANGTVNSHQKISDTQGNFTGTLGNLDGFGTKADTVGDLNNDGVSDMVVSGTRHPYSSTRTGALWILFMNTNGTVQSNQKIMQGVGGFAGVLDYEDYFGASVQSVGDLNNDGINDIAVGSWRDDDGSTDAGAVWILFLNANGTVNSHQKISSTQGNFNGTLLTGDGLGLSIANLGDINGDNIDDIAVSADMDDNGNIDAGAIWIMTLDTTGIVLSETKISATQGNFTGTLDANDHFGWGMESLGDINGGGKTEIAVGARFDDDGGTDRGAVWILFFDSVSTGIDENNYSNTIIIYPNPSTGKFKVQGVTAQIEVYDLFGRLLLRSNKPEIDMSSYPAGLYVWRVGTARGKLIIE